ncbi:MAG: hypothetical protein A2007_04625 [Verrucomicrobia bacterium GWC2_42_7]|nr:MAG: hypothetical protein A2007_04625 [Verrucomicrobia bacterium GWC2_42_7]
MTCPTTYFEGKSVKWLFFCFRRKGFLLSLVFLSTLTNGYSGAKLDKPIKNFKTLMFNDKGYRSWEISGREGLYINDNLVEIKDMHLQTFHGDQQGTLESTVLSPTATLFVKEHVMQGEKEIKILGQDYSVEGEDWKWNGSQKKFWINKSVKVEFTQKEIVTF